MMSINPFLKLVPTLLTAFRRQAVWLTGSGWTGKTLLQLSRNSGKLAVRPARQLLCSGADVRRFQLAVVLCALVTGMLSSPS